MTILLALLPLAFVALLVVAIVRTAKKRKALWWWLSAGLCIAVMIPVSILAPPVSVVEPSAASTAGSQTPSPDSSVFGKVKALVEAGDYEKAGALLEDNLYKHDIAWPDVTQLFSGHMDAVDVTVLYYSPLPGEDLSDKVGMLNATLAQKVPDYIEFYEDRVAKAGKWEYDDFDVDVRFGILKDAVGVSPSGKMLIYQRNDVHSHAMPLYAVGDRVLLGATALLDRKYVPGNTSEVQYVLTINFGLKYYGTYENGVIAYRVFATLQLLENLGGRTIHDFGRQDGGKPPDKIPDHTGKEIIGSYPTQEQLQAFLLDAINQINTVPETVFGG